MVSEARRVMARARLHATMAAGAEVVPYEPWVVRAGRSALPFGVYVYAADFDRVTLGASNGSANGEPLVRYWVRVHREHLERARVDVAAYAAREVREAVDAGYAMRFEEAVS